MVAVGCEGVLGLDWTPVDPVVANEGGGGSDAAPADNGGADHGPASGGGASVAGGGDGFNSSDAGACVVEQCPPPSNACLLPACVGGECVVVFAPSGTPCGGSGAAAICDGAGSCVACHVDSDCTGLGAACTEQVCSSCEDGLTNAAETDIDCGGPDCGPCSKGDTCLVDSDCKQNLDCVAGTCVKG
jgi:hypothetical protein